MPMHDWTKVEAGIYRCLHGSWIVTVARALNNGLVLEGREAVAVCRTLMGLTDGAKAPPGTIRGDLTLSVQNNLVHGSDSAENATAEIALWFPEGTIRYPGTDATWVD